MLLICVQYSSLTVTIMASRENVFQRQRIRDVGF